MLYQNVPTHLLAVDCVIFGYEKEQLKVLLFERNLEPQKGKISLVGGWVTQQESVEDAAARVLKNLTGLTDIFMEQVNVFSIPNRDSGGRVVSVVFYALIDIKAHNRELVDSYGAFWHSADELPQLIFDHEEMVQMSRNKLRQKATYDLVGRDLLPEQFTITQLRNLYNAIFQKEFDPGNFRKKILSLKALNRLPIKDTSESKKGAFFYKMKPENEYEIDERIVVNKTNI